MKIIIVGADPEPEKMAKVLAYAEEHNIEIVRQESREGVEDGVYKIDGPTAPLPPLITPYINVVEMIKDYQIPETFIHKTGEKISKYARPMVSNAYQGTPRNQTCPCGSGKKYKKCCQTQT